MNKEKATQVQVIFRYVKKDKGEQGVAGAFDLLFEEAFRMMSQKPVMAT